MIRAAPIVAAIVAALLASQALARDTSFTFQGTYKGDTVYLRDMSAEECAAILAKPVVKLSDKLIVATADIDGRACTSIGPKEEPDDVMHFVGFDQPIKFFRSTDPTQLDQIQVGDGPKVEVSIGAQMWTWEDGSASYLLVDNLLVTDKATGKEQCYQEPQKRFSCAVNPVQATSKQFDADEVAKLLNKPKRN